MSRYLVSHFGPASDPLEAPAVAHEVTSSLPASLTGYPGAWITMVQLLDGGGVAGIRVTPRDSRENPCAA